jgi:ssDNA-binding replication factor A large subunit
MSDENYEKIVEKISRSSGLEKEEIERRIEAKRAKLAGLISKEGAAQVIAAELGISFDNEKLKINELLPSMRKVNVVGKIINLSPVRTFTTKKGDEGKVVNLTIADDTSNIKVVLWDTNHIALIEKGEIKDGSMVDIRNGSMRSNELHLGSFSELKPSSEVLDNLVTEKIVKEKNIIDFKLADSISTRAFIVQAFDPKFFHVCPECRKKAVQEAEGFSCAEHGKINPDKRALINLVLDDGTESIRSVLFQDALNELNMGDLEDSDNLIIQRQNLLGKEMVFSGDIRMNSFFNNPEFIVENVKEVNPDELIAVLEKE